jgi:ABC-2 type transport system permease protein
VKRYARISGISWREQSSERGRIINCGIRLSIQLLVTVSIWRGLYAHSADSGGIPEGQAITYAVLGLLVTQNGGIDRFFSRDSTIEHIQLGTVIFWFLRPLSPRRYYALRAAGDRAYCLLWGVAGYAVCIGVGVVQLPHSNAGAILFVLSFTCGQLTLYYLNTLLDLFCFWATVNQSAVNIYQFLLNLLSGAIAPLWFFPDLFLEISSWLPFETILNTPLSIYVGRVSGNEALRSLAVQGAWAILLAVTVRSVWHRAQSRLNIQGG